MNEPWTIIADSLRAEIAGFGGLLNLFEQQQQSLFTRDTDGVLRLSGEIEAHTRDMQEHRVRREQIVAEFALANGQPARATLRSLLPFIAAEARPLIEALIAEVNVLIHRVRRVTRQNHSLLARTVESHQELMRTLRPDAFQQTYSAAGRKTLTSNARAAGALQAAG
ncbi:MAG TPA: flagellar protein FlgN [Lacunisphaera sp.]|nr:flagellar protein FlgN [Lacunisphaera sp.]